MDANQHEFISRIGRLRLTEARSGARVCDPQRVAITFVSMGVYSWFQKS